MIFSLRQIQEKRAEQKMELYVVFIDFTKAFDTVSRNGLWRVLKKFGSTEKTTNLTTALHAGMQATVVQGRDASNEFHAGMQAKVVQGRDASNEFAVTNGVKQGCVLASTLFSLYLTAMLEVTFKNLNEGIYIQTRHGADLFDVAQFKSKTRITKHLVKEMLFTDDCALVAHWAADMQVLVNNFAKAVAQFSLKINIKKTEYMYQPIKLIHPPPEPEIVMIESRTSCTRLRLYLSRKHCFLYGKNR